VFFFVCVIFLSQVYGIFFILFLRHFFSLPCEQNIFARNCGYVSEVDWWVGEISARVPVELIDVGPADGGIVEQRRASSKQLRQQQGASAAARDGDIQREITAKWLHQPTEAETKEMIQTVTQQAEAFAARLPPQNHALGSNGGEWRFVIGLVGKPSAGKSTFFNAVTDPDSEAAAARVAPFPFTTIEPNKGRCFVGGPRTRQFCRLPAAPSLVAFPTW